MGKAVWLRVAAVVVGGAFAGAGAPAASAWTQVTSSNEANINEVSLARSADGTLHVAWTRPSAGTGAADDLLQTPISATGAVGGSTSIASQWAAFSNPFIAVTPGGGLDVFAGGIHSTNAGDPHTNLSLFTSTDGGATWMLYPTDLTDTGSAYSSDVAAAFGTGGGGPFLTWGSSTCLCVHDGLVRATPNADFQQGLGDFGYDPAIAVDRSSGQMVVAWYSNATGHSGIFAATVDPATGMRSGAPVAMPDTSDLTDGPFSGRTPLAARAGGGLYVAYPGGYPTHDRLLLWRVGAGTSTVMATAGADIRSVGLAADPDRRLWLYWSVTTGARDTPTVFARRSNPQLTAWGSTVKVAPPGGASTSWNLVGDAQASRLDLLGSFSLGTVSSAATWATQVLPGLTLSASPALLRKGRKHPTKVTFTVSDAGIAVAGARVRVGRVSGTANAHGKVKLALGPFSRRTRLTAVASDAGYVAASVKLAVR